MYDRNSIPVPRHLDPPSNVPDVALTSSRYDGKSKPVELREMHHGHLAAITYLDTQIGKVLDELERLDLLDDTIIVWWSDHGLHLGEHGLRRKTTAFELDAHVPLIIATPEHKGVSELMHWLNCWICIQRLLSYVESHPQPAWKGDR